jgi:hypothetical protein
MTNITSKIKAYLAGYGILSLVALFAACDVLEDDASPRNPDIEIKDNELHILADGNAYIDLHSMVKTNGKIRLNVSSQPGRGELSEPAKGLLRYAPFEDFKKGRDSFAFSIFGESNELLATDTVIIIVEDDTTDLPCGYFPQDDWVSSTTSPISVDVLQNDFLCGDSSDIRLEIYRPDNSFPPHSGNASVVQNRIVYTGNFSELSDTVIYKVSKVSDSSVVGFGALYIEIGNFCTPHANEDSVAYNHHGWPTDTLSLAVMLNDELCGSTISSFSIAEQPANGDAVIVGTGNNSLIKYSYGDPTMDSTQMILDSLKYQWCIGSQCYTGKVRIRLY